MFLFTELHKLCSESEQKETILILNRSFKETYQDHNDNNRHNLKHLIATLKKVMK